MPIRPRAGVQKTLQESLAQQEFVLAYQPKVDMRYGKVIGVEALIRWMHPQRGLLQPGAFVPMIEDSVRVEQLGHWVIGEALRQAAEWLAVGAGTPISVNISPRHLMYPGFLAQLDVQLARFPQLPAGALELEIVESAPLEDLDAAARVVEACGERQVPVHLDDFGTGHSCLSWLRRLPVTAVKLDQSFVRGVLAHEEDRVIVRGILAMAEGLGLKAIAEGVESLAHGDALMALGCTLGQGYGIAKPMPAGELPKWRAGFESGPPWGRAAPELG